MNRTERVEKDFPQQFQGKKRIELLVRAICHQLEEVEQVLNDLTRLRNIENATGKLLDGVGDIVVLNRSDAMRLIQGPIQYRIMDDDHYRHFLWYKILKNTSNCSYYDIVTAIQMLWGAENIEYFENPEQPATFTVTFPEPDGSVGLDDIPPIRAAGVGIHIRATSNYSVNGSVYAGAVAGASHRINTGLASRSPKPKEKLVGGCACFISEVLRIGTVKGWKRSNAI